MNRYVQKLSYLRRAAIGLALLAPYYALAQCPAGTLCNPLKAQSIQELATALIDVVLIIALPIGVLFIILGGFYLVTAGGDKTGLEKGYKTLLGAIIGIAIVLAAKLLASILGNTLTDLQVGL